MARHRNGQWNLPDKLESYDQAILAVLMDVRDELPKFMSNQNKILIKLEAIRKNTTKRNRKKKHNEIKH